MVRVRDRDLALAWVGKAVHSLVLAKRDGSEYFPDLGGRVALAILAIESDLSIAPFKGGIRKMAMVLDLGYNSTVYLAKSLLDAGLIKREAEASRGSVYRKVGFPPSDADWDRYRWLGAVAAEIAKRFPERARGKNAHILPTAAEIAFRDGGEISESALEFLEGIGAVEERDGRVSPVLSFGGDTKENPNQNTRRKK